MYSFRHLLFTCFLAIGIVACEKDKAKDEAEVAGNGLRGTWELSQSFGGMMPSRTYAPGNGNLLRFDSLHYQMIRGGQIVYQTNYWLERDSVVDVQNCSLLPPSSAAYNKIVTDSNSHFGQFFELKGNTLKITSGCIPLDGGGSVYRRISGDAK